ncbi:hypothetical protein BSL82_01325 [Tardibacter chloracetimidivorans]|uniref:Uncharacterized protein n=2 Tax=Tardibacter chloracetimidivorans TaxID=1921510 RepID=A0A1L3ZR59_9SPHN|nr:hypothetical protein BSL82_01325 [Tardibacter chloracetimidivorans]
MYALFGGLIICGAKLGYLLFGISSEPPEDPLALKSWERKRRWLVISELAALPAFAAIAVLAGRLRHWPVEGVVALSMVLGALGFAFFLDAVRTLVSRRLNIGGGNG